MSRPFGNRGLLLEIYHTEIQDACLLQRSLQAHHRLRGIPQRPFGEAIWHCLLRASPKKLRTSPFIGSTQQPCQSGGVSLVALVAFDNHGTAFFPWKARKGKSQHPATGRKEQTNSDMLMSTKRPLSAWLTVLAITLYVMKLWALCGPYYFEWNLSTRA